MQRVESMRIMTRKSVLSRSLSGGKGGGGGVQNSS